MKTTLITGIVVVVVMVVAAKKGAQTKENFGTVISARNAQIAQIISECE